MQKNSDIRMVDKIEMVAISDLKPYENNARLNDNAVPALMESIKRFGFVVPIVITREKSIVCGHTRVKAASKLGMGQTPCVYADGLTEAEIRALRLADNKVSEIAMWDMEKLDAELASIGSEIDMSDFGFDIEDPYEKEEPQEENEEGIGLGETEEPKSQYGKVYILGDHRLMCGDSTKEDDWEILMDGKKGDMMFTDPPYGVSIGTKNKTLNANPCSHGNHSKNRIESNLENDELSPEELKEQLLVPAFRCAKKNLSESAMWFVCSAQMCELLSITISSMNESGLTARHVIIWNKNRQTFSMNRLDYDYKHEPILYGWDKKHENARNGKFRTSVWDFDVVSKCKLHPTMKPIELVVNAIMDGTAREGQIVIDAFGGSGTTIMAAEATGRRAFVMEKDPKYCDVIRKRWAEQYGNGEDWEKETPEE